MVKHGARPPSVYTFCEDLGITEETFYGITGSFEGLERKIWKGFLDNTISLLTADEAYFGFSSREKILTFYYSFFESLKSSRSFVLTQLKNHSKREFVPEYLKDFKSGFETYIDGVLNNGKANGEIPKRPYIERTYSKVFWGHMGFLLLFWRDDSSADFEKTDVVIEKTVNLAFDLIGKGVFDATVDLAKFLYQTKVK